MSDSTTTPGNKKNDTLATDDTSSASFQQFRKFHGSAKHHGEEMVIFAVLAGMELLELQKKLMEREPGFAWLVYLSNHEDDLGCGIRTAQKYMRLAEAVKSEILKGGHGSAVISLLDKAPSTMSDAQAEKLKAVMAKSINGESLSETYVKMGVISKPHASLEDRDTSKPRDGGKSKATRLWRRAKAELGQMPPDDKSARQALRKLSALCQDYFDDLADDAFPPPPPPAKKDRYRPTPKEEPLVGLIVKAYETLAGAGKKDETLAGKKDETLAGKKDETLAGKKFKNLRPAVIRAIQNIARCRSLSFLKAAAWLLKRTQRRAAAYEVKIKGDSRLRNRIFNAGPFGSITFWDRYAGA